MPMTCLNAQNERLTSIDYSSAEWNQLKTEYETLGLHMKCCGAPAIPKTSQHGTQFFAHKSDACGEGLESIEHILCKELIVKGAKQANWEANPEELGEDIEGNQWIADVLCVKNQQKIAFEVQLSSQTFAEYKRRTLRYQQSGVWSLWLIRRTKKNPIGEQMILDRIGSTKRKDVIGHRPDRQDMPVFQVDIVDRENIFVFFPWHHGQGPYELPLDLFVRGALSGQMSFRDGCWCWNA
jgi:hypothetical protein